MEERTVKELWEDVERQNLEKVLDSDIGSDEGKVAFKQATEARSVLNEEAKVEESKKEHRRRLFGDIAKGLALGVGTFLCNVALRSIDHRHDKELMHECMEFEMGDDENDPHMFTTSAGKETRKLFFRRR